MTVLVMLIGFVLSVTGSLAEDTLVGRTGRGRTRPLTAAQSRVGPSSRDMPERTASGAGLPDQIPAEKRPRAFGPRGIGGKRGPGLPGASRGSLGTGPSRRRVLGRHLAPRQRDRASRLVASRVSHPLSAASVRLQNARPGGACHQQEIVR